VDEAFAYQTSPILWMILALLKSTRFLVITRLSGLPRARVVLEFAFFGEFFAFYFPLTTLRNHKSFLFHVYDLRNLPPFPNSRGCQEFFWSLILLPHMPPVHHHGDTSAPNRVRKTKGCLRTRDTGLIPFKFFSSKPSGLLFKGPLSLTLCLPSRRIRTHTSTFSLTAQSV